MTCDIPAPLETITSRQSTPRYIDDSMDISYPAPAKNQEFYPHGQMLDSGNFFVTGDLGGAQQQVTTPSQNELLPGYPIPGAPAMCNTLGKDHRQFRPVLQNNNNFHYNTFAPAMQQAGPSYVYQSQQPASEDVVRNTNSYAFPIQEECIPSFNIADLPQPSHSYSPLAPQNVYPTPPPWPFISREDQLTILETEIMVQAAKLDIVMARGRTSQQGLSNYLRAIQLHRHTMAINPLNYVSPTQPWNHPNQGFYGNAVPQFPVPPPQFRGPVPRHLLQRPMCLSCLALARSKMRVREWLDSIAMVELDAVPDDDLDGYELEGDEDVEFSEADGESEDEEEDEEEDDDGEDDDDDNDEEDGSEEEDRSSEDESELDSDEDTSDCSFKPLSRSAKNSLRIVPSMHERVLKAPQPYTAYPPDFITEL